MSSPRVRPDAMDATTAWQWAPVGESAIMVSWHGEPEERAPAVRELLDRAHRLETPPFRELVPGIASVLVVYDPLRWTAPEVWGAIAAILPAEGRGSSATPRIVEIGVRYGGDDGPDLDAVAQACGMSPAEVVAIHTQRPYPVLMLGFMPGFPYLGDLDPRLRLPRRPTPRTVVRAGSVAIANDQTGIYPSQSPGGWHLLGRTSVPLFDPTRDPPSTLQPGDMVRFYVVDD
jgi:KipI family sensor histidine kinase inhibitor